MGGHQSGEIASSLAVRTVAHYVLNRFYLSFLTSEVRDTAQPALNELLVDAVRAANEAVATQVPGGGTTLTCALAMGSRVYLAHVGDSRAYVIADGEMSQITHDHSLVDRLVELGQLTRDEAAIHPQKNVLYRAVGQRGVLEVDTYAHSIPQGGRLLLCSDGLWGLVGDAEMMEVILNASSSQGACEELVDAANQAGGRDNITIVLAELPLG
jgi:protein phosphatase